MANNDHNISITVFSLVNVVLFFTLIRNHSNYCLGVNLIIIQINNKYNTVRSLNKKVT